MVTRIWGPEVVQCLHSFKEAAKGSSQKTVKVNGKEIKITYPFPSPQDWRDCWVYFLMIDRFNNPGKAPNGPWNKVFDFRQGGTFKGVIEKLGYLQKLGVKAIWLSPVLKNSKPENWRWNYHGYGTQDFLNVDERFGSDGTRETAERELIELVEQAHARGMHVILDIVLNHSARVFDYFRNGQEEGSFKDPGIMDGGLGTEPPIRWLDGSGARRADWQEEPPVGNLAPDDAIWPEELQQRIFFRRRGEKLTDSVSASRGFVPGDFGVMRQLVAEYDGRPASQKELRRKYGSLPVLNMLVHIYSYLIAKFDFDGFRIDTVKYVEPGIVEIFGNAIREFAQGAGKRNFFTFGEIADHDEATIAGFVGRNKSTEGFGIDAALDFPLHNRVTSVVKGIAGVETIRQVFEDRKKAEKDLLSSHGEAGRFFVTFLDNHDQHERFSHPQTPQEQVTQALALLFSLPGIPCLYYGMEQGLQGTIHDDGKPDLSCFESVREALWGKQAKAFDLHHPVFKQVKALANLRLEEPALRFGRLYFRQVSGNGQDFGFSRGAGGILAFSRILSDRETLVVANMNAEHPFAGHVLVDSDLNREARTMKVAYSNLGSSGSKRVAHIQEARFYEGQELVGIGEAAARQVQLAPMEVQILVS